LLIVKAGIILIALLLGLPAFASYPQRIVSGIPSATEMLFALDLGDQVVGVTTNCNYPPEAKKKEKVGGFFLNAEKIVSLKPDLVVMIEDAQKPDIHKLKSFGLPVFALNPHTVDDVAESLIQLGEKTGKKWKAEVLARRIRYSAARFRPKVFSLDFILRRPRVLVVVGYKPLIVAGGGTFIDDIIKCAGAENIAAGARAAYPEFSLEKLLQADPGFLVIPEGILSLQEIKADNRWQKLAAVKNGRILFINADILSRPGPRVGEAIEKIARFVHE
jgi:iron complex transport system substrate-binding protein